MGLLLTQQGWAQIYSASYANSEFKYFDVTTNTWTNKEYTPEVLINLTAFQGKIYGVASGTTKFYLYDPATDTWTAKTPKTFKGGSIVTAGNYIYAVQVVTTNASFSRYDPATDTWVSLSNVGIPSVTDHLVYDGGDYIYCSNSSATSRSLARYSISGNSWTALPLTPTVIGGGLAFKNGKIYVIAGIDISTDFYSFDPTTSTYKQLANVPTINQNLISGDGNYLYANPNTSTNFYRYNVATNTWNTYTGAGANFYALAYMENYCAPTASVIATPATCAGTGGVNANAALTLTAYGGGVTKVGYSTGSSYTGPAFASATAVTAAPMTLSNTLVNPTVAQPYTVRVFQDATCYKDVVVMLTPTLCLTSDLSLSLSPVSQTGVKGEQLTYTFTLTNAGPDVATGVQVDIKVPTNATLLTASPQVGVYSEATHKWDISSLPVGSKTLTVTLKMN
jgi:uncharacterized repeat protein (TIGR01451 family)